MQAFRGDAMLFEAKTDVVKAVAVCPTDPEIAFVSWHGWLRVVDAETGALRWSFQSPSQKVLQPLTCVAYSPDGQERGFLATEDLPTNCCFGRGEEASMLYVTSGKGLYRVRLPQEGYHVGTAR